MAGYRLRQSGEEVQGILDNAAMRAQLTAETERAQTAEQQLQTNIDSEAQARHQADTTLDGKIAAEKTRAEGAEGSLQTAINNEAQARQQADGVLDGKIAAEKTRAEGAEGSLQTAINNEAQTREQADTTLDGKIAAEKTRAEGAEGALQTAIDNEAKARRQTDGALDVSELNATENPHTLAKYVNLSAAIAAIPTDYQKGGMSIKFVQSSDNKYVQARCMAQNFTINTTQWAIDSDGIYVEDEDYLFYLLDSNRKIFLALKKDGDIQFGYGVPSQIVTYVTGLINALGVDTILTFLNGVQVGNTIDGLYGGYKDDDNYLYVLADANKKMLMAYKKDGTLVCNNIDSPTITAINNSITDIIHRIDNLNVKHTLNVQNSDKIAIVGDSYTQSNFCVKGKSYIQKLSLFSDYVWSNFGVSGDTYAGRMEAIRTNATANGSIAFVEQAIKYAMLCCYTNDVKYMSVDDYITCTKQICMLLQGIGVTPIICTEYHTGNTAALKTSVRSSLKKLAENYNLSFFDIASIVELIIGNSKYIPFWNETHPGTRSNAIESDNYEKYLSALERPTKSLKLFRARNNSYESLDEYMFHSIENRAEIFKEILVGAKDISNAANVDNCTSAAKTQNNSEYQLLASKLAVAFNKVSLLSAVLSTDKNHLESLILNISHTSESLHVYVKNTLASPYPESTKYSSFQVTFDTEPSVDSTYKCEEDETTYTVKAVVIGGDGMKNLLCLPYVASPSSDTGTLTKLSGTGDATISYTHRERGMDIESISDDTIGHWSEVTPEQDGSYNLGEKPNCIDVDRIDILLVSESEYNITDVELTYTGEEKDTHKGVEFVFETNLYNSNTELLPASTFGTIGVLDTNWNVTPTNTYEGTNGTNVFPVGCSSKVNVDSVNKLSCNVIASKAGNAVMEVWCRYFPDVYTNGSGNQITEDSYDYSDLIVSLNNVIMKEKVNTHWKIVRFPIWLVAGTHAIDVYSNKSLEIAYVSLKYKN